MENKDSNINIFHSSHWGPALWHVLHTIAAKYPKNPSEKRKVAHFQMFNSFKYTLPCETCQEHYTKYFNQHLPQLNNSLECRLWVLDLHNFVSRRLGNDAWTLSDIDAKYPPEEDEEPEDPDPQFNLFANPYYKKLNSPIRSGSKTIPLPPPIIKTTPLVKKNVFTTPLQSIGNKKPAGMPRILKVMQSRNPVAARKKKCNCGK